MKKRPDTPGGKGMDAGMNKPEIPNLKLIIASGCAVVVLLAALIAMLAVLGSMEEPLINLNVSMTSTPTFSMAVSSEPESSEAVSSEEESSEPVSSQTPASSAPPASRPAVSSQPPVSSEPVSSEEEPVSSEEEASSEPQVPDRADGITRIELVNISGGRSGDLPPEQFDEFLMNLYAISFEETEDEIDSSVAADARIWIYRGDQMTVYTVYPFWARGNQVLLELNGGKQFLQYLKTLEVFAGESFPY